MAQFQLLGPVEVRTEGRLVDAGQPRQRCVLAALLVDAGRLVTWETLIDRVWGVAPPKGARGALYSHATRVRQVLHRAAAPGEPTANLKRRAGGYLLDVPTEQVDVHRFRQLVELARDPTCGEARRRALLGEALGLWAGEPLAGLTGRWVTQFRERSHQLRLDSTMWWAQAELEAGNPTVPLDSLIVMLDAYPLVEPLAALLMRALRDAGHTARALEIYKLTRLRLIDELGVEPGAELRRVHLAILRGDRSDVPAEAVRSTTAPRTGAVRDVPAQLPVGIRGFAGRTTELTRLDAVLSGSGTQVTGPSIVALLGTAGVGKTALAVHWGHRAAEQFPDGQLYVNLRGFDPAMPAMDPGEALRGFFAAFGVTTQRVPVTLDAQAALYRSLLATRRVLVVLDNARDAEQVRPLLPGSAGCLVIVTSRNRLPSLISVEGAEPVILDLLTPADAEQLLAARLGAARVAAEPDAVHGIAASCARLPLALAIASARAATQPALSLRSLAQDLHEAGDRLDGLSGQDALTDIRAVFSWSYRALSPAAAGVFRLLGSHPGADLAAPAAASLAAVPSSRIRPLLTELVDANLVTEHTPGRYALHDLLRVYAAELAQEHDSQEQRRAALHRFLDHYLHTAREADRLLFPRRDPIAFDERHPGVEPQQLAGESEASAWFAAEYQVLVAAIGHAAGAGFDDHAWRLAWTAATFLDRQGHWHDWVATAQLALEAAVRIGDRAGQAHAHRQLAGGYICLNRYHDANVHLDHALDVQRAVRDETGQAHTHLDLCLLFERQGRYQDVLDHAQTALRIYRASGHVAGQARALNTVGWSHSLLGNHELSLDCCEQALALLREIGDRPGEAHTWDSLGYAHNRLGHRLKAIACYQRAILVFRELGERFYEAATLERLGDTHHSAGDRASANDAWCRALDILDQIGYVDTHDIRAKLDAA